MLFTFRVYLDENVHAPQRDLLIVSGKPITVRKADAHTVVFQLAKTYGVGERLFDGLAILPRHLLEKPYQEGKLGQSGSLATAADQWAGLGPFRLKEYVAGQRLVLERNPSIGNRTLKAIDCLTWMSSYFYSCQTQMPRS